MKRTPLNRKTPLKSYTTLKRTQMKRRSSSGVPKSVAQVVKDRAAGRCEAGTPKCVGRVDHLHHRLLRSQGGKHTEDNLLAVCMPCHTFIHHHPQRSVDNGWIVRPHAA